MKQLEHNAWMTGIKNNDSSTKRDKKERSMDRAEQLVTLERLRLLRRTAPMMMHLRCALERGDVPRAMHAHSQLDAVLRDFLSK